METQSLNLDNEGFAFSTVASTDIAATAAATFDGGSGDVTAEDLQLQVDTTAMTAAQADLGTLPTPSALGVCPGATLTVVKANTAGATVTYTDPVTGIVYNYMNKQGESLTLQADNVNDQWVVRP